jgi:predicted  nucleic acid-binding Zn-ribbon protein
MGDNLVSFVPRAPQPAAPARPSTLRDRLVRLGQLDAAIGELEDRDRELVRQVEEQRSQITLLKMRLHKQTATPQRAGLQGDAVGEAERERQRERAQLQSSLEKGLRAFEDTLGRAHKQRLELRRKRESPYREHAALLDALEAPVRAAYEDLVRSGRTPAIVPLQEGRCSGCHTKAPVGTARGAEERTEAARCPGCERFLTGCS